MAISNPIINFNIESAVQKVANEEQKILVIGQKIAAGTATPNVVVNDIGDDFETLLGITSIAAQCVRAIRRIEKIANQKLRIDVLPLVDGTGSVAANGDIAITGTATADGTYIVTVGSVVNHRYTINVVKGDDIAAIVFKIFTAIDSDPKVPVTALNLTTNVDITAENKGFEGNHISIGITGEVPGVSYIITQLSGGTGDPDNITDKSAFNAISSETRYQGIVYPSTYASSADYDGLSEFLEARFPVNNVVLDGNAILVKTEDASTLKSLASDVNNKSITLIGNPPINRVGLRGSAIIELDYVMSAYLVAIRALRLTEDASIGQFITGTQGSLDDKGGMALASLPYMNTAFTDLLLPAEEGDFWTDAEIRDFLVNGVSVVGNNRLNTDVITGQIVTTYLKDSLGEDDITFKYLNYFDTFTVIREYIFNNMQERFAQSRLVEGDLVPLRSDANVATVKGYLLNLYQDLANLALVEKGRAATKFFSDNLTITLDKANGKITVLMLVSPVVQLREFDNTMQVVFDVIL